MYFTDLIKLFYETVHSLNAKDYTNEQLDTWAPKQVNIEKWKNRIQNNFVVLAKNNSKIIGWGELSPKGCIDMLYVHKNYLRKNVGQKLVRVLSKKLKS